MEHVNDCCFRDIYKGGLIEDDLYVCFLKQLLISEGIRIYKIFHI